MVARVDGVKPRITAPQLLTGQPLDAAIGSSFLGKCFASIDANQCDAVAKCSCLLRSLQARLDSAAQISAQKSHAYGFRVCVETVLTPHARRLRSGNGLNPTQRSHKTPHQLTQRVLAPAGTGPQLANSCTTAGQQQRQAPTKPARSVGQQKQRRAGTPGSTAQGQPRCEAEPCPSGSPARSSSLP